MNKRNLTLLQFSVLPDSADDPICEGPHKSVYRYLKTDIQNEELDDLKIAAKDKAKRNSLDPIPAEKWVKWWENFVLSHLIENDFNDNVMTNYPDIDIDLTELKDQ